MCPTPNLLPDNLEQESEARERQLIKSLEESTRQLSESETDKEMINQVNPKSSTLILSIGNALGA
jgi:hypothetical protein